WVGKDIRLPFGPEKEENFSLTSEIRNIPMEEFLGGVPPEKRNLTGTLNLKGKISGKGRNLSGWMETLNGEVSLSVEDGVLKKSGVLAKILLLLNVSRIFSQDYSHLLVKGMHYNTIQGGLQIENGIARTESILFDSPSVKMDAVGDINLGGGTLDMEIAVAPLETVDKVVEKIPILGTILMGDEAAVVVTYYKVTGSFEDPEVKQIVFQSLGRKAMGIFMRIFNLPVTILKPGGNRSKEKNHGRMIEEPEISSQWSE
ncbi:MAG: AsmA-like C-terminal region-containing protein, partial [Deltaproteobacteria bacterium]|nr:AsmA-like C-terminal region-containing protein [Deltaproteobacteria bacterium]